MANRLPPLDAGQREAVFSLENAVVSAGAGSGKTTVLAERYLTLVREGRADVEEILTLTYTRKAAAEMYERIYRRLREEADDPRIREQIARFDRAQISTLDSFCVQVVRNSPQYFGVRADFVLGEEQNTRSDEETALAFLLDHSDDPALLSFIALNGFESVWKEFFVSLGSDYFHLAAQRDFETVYRTQIDTLKRIARQTAAELSTAGIRIREIDADSIKAIVDAKRQVAGLDELTTLLESEQFEEAGARLEQIKLNRRTGRASSEEVAAYKELADELDRLKKQLASAIFTLASRETLRRLFELCDEYQEILLRRKRVSGSLSFRDVVEMAVRLLTENRELRRFYKRRYRYLMIDEFQDNNELQKRLLYLLAEREEEEAEGLPGPEHVAPDKLFFVGDEKQSIYRFRGADVAVFRGLSDELKGSGGRAISLSTNYRSAPPLIDFYNRFFRMVFADPSEEFEARFSPLSAGLAGNRPLGRPGNEQGSGTGEELGRGEASGEESRSSPTAGESPGEGDAVSREASIRLFYKPYSGPPEPGDAHSDDAEAYFVARFIKESVERASLFIREDGRRRAAEWGDFALLMRTTSNQIRYERVLRRLGIPYATQSVRTLFLEAPLNDLYAALETVAHPDDRTAYAALLRSPLVNLSDAVVVEILAGEDEPFAALPPAIDPHSTDAEHFLAGGELFRHLDERADFVPIARLVDDLWYRFGYRYHILRDASSHPYLEYYDYFRKLASDADREGSTLSEFLDFIRPNLGKYEKLPELEVVRDQGEGVQLLTIHKAKGLEFPVVILANAGNLGRSSGEGKRPYYLSDEFGLTLRVTDRGNYFYTIAEEENRRKEEAEVKRLLYVALTRAKSHLVVSGCHNRQNRSAEGALLNMVLDIIGQQDARRSGAEHGSGAPPAEGEAAASAVAAASAGTWQPSKDFSSVRLHIIPTVSEAELLARRRGRAGADVATLVEAYRSAEQVEWTVRKRSFSASEVSERVWRRVREPSPQAGLFPEGYSNPEPLPALRSDPVIEEQELETTFGMLVHAVIERRLAGRGRPGEQDLPAGVRRAIHAGFIEQLLGEAERLADGFFASQLGGRATRAARRQTERTFLYEGAPGCTVRGTFDLLFEDEEGVCVIDFKTDRELQPAAYAVQLHAYRLAAAALLRRPVTAFLFYLRGDSACEVDERLLLPLYRQYFEVSPVARRVGLCPERFNWGGEGAPLFGQVVESLAVEAQAEIGR